MQNIQANCKTKKKEARLASHFSTFFGTAAAHLRTSFAMVNVMPIAFISTCITDSSTKVTELLCKLAIHWHQRRRSPAKSSTFPIDLSTTCHHFDISLFQVRCSTKFTCFSTTHADVYAALPFRILECCGTSHLLPSILNNIFTKNTRYFRDHMSHHRHMRL